MKTIPEFPFAINRHCKLLDIEVLKWAWEAGLFESPTELERCRLHKLNWFAGYLFPEEKPERLRQIMKFFLCLFLLDDLLDIFMDKAMVVFLDGLKIAKSCHANNRLQCLGSELLLLGKEIEKEFAFPHGKEKWNMAWLEYLEAQQWEIQTKFDGIPPVLEEYRIHRPNSSGVYMALHLLQQEKDMRGCISHLLEFGMARYIYLSNDLASYAKEQAIEDPLNEVLILMESMGHTAFSSVQLDVKQLRESIIQLAEQVCSHFDECGHWIRRLFLLAGGCEAWTRETSRYQSYINGCLSSD